MIITLADIIVNVDITFKILVLLISDYAYVGFFYPSKELGVGASKTRFTISYV